MLAILKTAQEAAERFFFGTSENYEGCLRLIEVIRKGIYTMKLDQLDAEMNELRREMEKTHERLRKLARQRDELVQERENAPSDDEKED